MKATNRQYNMTKLLHLLWTSNANLKKVPFGAMKFRVIHLAAVLMPVKDAIIEDIVVGDFPATLIVTGQHPRGIGNFHATLPGRISGKDTSIGTGSSSVLEDFKVCCSAFRLFLYS